MHGLIAETAGGAWSLGGALLTFLFPMLLFIAVGTALYVLYTKPETVPGRQVRPPGRPVSYTAVPGTSAVGSVQAVPAEGGAAASTSVGPSAEATASEASPSAEATASEASASEASAYEARADEAARTEGAE